MDQRSESGSFFWELKRKNQSDGKLLTSESPGSTLLNGVKPYPIANEGGSNEYFRGFKEAGCFCSA